VVSFVICALAIGGAIFMILEMDSPLQGLMMISDLPLANALSHMPLGK
jgi:membrane-bound ClpP family serine protease